MTCRDNECTSAVVSVARAVSGLSDTQARSVFHAAQRESRYAHDTPVDLARWREFVDRQIDLVESDARFTPARRESLLTRLRAGRDEPGTGRTLSVLENLPGLAMESRASLDRALRNAADRLDLTVEQTQERYDAYEAAVDRRRDAPAPEGYGRDARIALRRRGLPSDRGTYEAIRRLDADVENADLDQVRNSPQRIVRRPVSDGGALTEIGYDSADGRLEVAYRDRPGQVYAYRSVPGPVWQSIRDADQPSDEFCYLVRNTSAYRYASVRDAVHDGLAQRCAECGQFATSEHACPVLAERAAAAAAEAEARHRSLRDNADLIARGEPLPDRPDIRRLSDDDSIARLSGRNLPGATGQARYDSWTSVPARTIREAAAVGPVSTPVCYAGNRAGITGPNGGYFRVSGDLLVDNPATGHWALSAEDLRCDCPQYRENYTCEHVTFVASQAAAIIVAPVGAQTDLARVALANTVIRRALESDWARSQDHAHDIEARWQQSGDPADSYATNPAAFDEDVAVGRARQASGQSPVVLRTSNATEGICAPGGRGFGIEVEFDLPDVDPDEQAEVLEAIGVDLHAAGLTGTAWQQEYHTAEESGYTTQMEGGWSFEEDGTVAGEVVSPILYDTPETWAQIAQVCEIVKRHGGRATASTGSHVHISTDSYDHDVTNHTELLRMAAQHEDVLYRVAANPDSGAHRGVSWCGPNQTVAPDGYGSVHTASDRHSGHELAVNLANATGTSQDHVEFRHWDGTLDPAVIQTQVAISAALADAAQRSASLGPTTPKHERLGAHAIRRTQILNGSRRQLTADERNADTASARSLADTLFRTRESKAQFAALFGANRWQRPSGPSDAR